MASGPDEDTGADTGDEGSEDSSGSGAGGLSRGYIIHGAESFPSGRPLRVTSHPDLASLLHLNASSLLSLRLLLSYSYSCSGTRRTLSARPCAGSPGAG